MGTLATIDTEKGNIAMKAVQSLGTEGRRQDGPQVAASEEIYDYIVFRGADIQDLEVMTGAEEDPAAVPKAAPAAVPQAAPQVPQAAPVPRAAPAPAPAPFPQAVAPQAPPNAWGNPNTPKAAPAGGAKKPVQAASMAVAGLGPKGSKGGATGGQPAAVKAPAAAPVKKPASFAAALGGGGAGPNGGGRAGAPSGPRGGQGGPRYPQQHQQRHGGGYQGQRGQHGHQQYQQHMHPAANQGRHMAYPPRPAPVHVPTEDFDFSASTAKFEKISVEPQAQAESGPAAYDKDDFFDSLSNEETTKMGNQRPNYSQMKRVDAETFGGAAAGAQGGQRGYGGNQRGGYGGGGGRRGGRGGGQQQRNASSRGSWKKVQH